jgi:hypothetical protein
MMSLVFDYLELVADVEPSQPIIAVVTGATGINGNAMVSYLSHFPKQVPTIIAISKSTKNTTGTDWYNAPHVRHLALDLLDTDKVNEQIEYHKHLFAQATHLFHMSYIEKDSDDEMIEVNMKMLRNMIEGLEKVTKLDHVALIDGRCDDQSSFSLLFLIRRQVLRITSWRAQDPLQRRRPET